LKPRNVQKSECRARSRIDNKKTKTYTMNISDLTRPVRSTINRKAKENVKTKDGPIIKERRINLRDAQINNEEGL
jgi:hypothetical protein